MKRYGWLIALGASLMFLAVSIYVIHYLIFRDAHHIYIYLVGDLAFLPIEVLLVTLIVDRLLGSREKHATMEKMNMVIGAFFSEMGLDMIKRFIGVGICPSELAEKMKFNGKWEDADFKKTAIEARRFNYQVDPDRCELMELRGFLLEKRDFFLRLLENPNLLEHDTFTDLLWAVNHLSEELLFRDRLDGLSPADFKHIDGDIRRVFQLLIFEWLQYLKHLKNVYPYLFSLAVRTNPFDREACVQIT